MAGWEALFSDTMTTSGVILQPPSADPSGSGGAPRRKRWPKVLTVVLVILLVAVIVSFRINLPYFALVPGQAQAVGPLLTVPSGRGHHVNGQLLLTDVGEGDVTLGNWLYYKLDSNAVLYKKSDFIQTGVSEQQYDDQGTVEMDESQLTAAAVSLRQLGYSVPYHDAGVLVWATQAGSGAYNVLQVGNVITAVDSYPTPTVEALTVAEAHFSPGQEVTLKVGSIDDPSKDHDVTLKLTSIRERQGAATHRLDKPVHPAGLDLPVPRECQCQQHRRTVSGSRLHARTARHIERRQSDRWPHDLCDRDDLRRRNRGRVCGVPQKTIAVENAHASVFLVPEAEVSQAKQKATKSLHVFGVTTLAQALQDLESLGGKLGAAAHGPVPGVGGHSVPTDADAFPCGY